MILGVGKALARPGGRRFQLEGGGHLDHVEIAYETWGTLAADGPPEQALSAEMIARVWGVQARWLGEPGARALVV